MPTIGTSGPCTYSQRREGSLSKVRAHRRQSGIEQLWSPLRMQRRRIVPADIDRDQADVIRVGVDEIDRLVQLRAVYRSRNGLR